MRVALWALLALIWLLDAVAQICTAVIATLFGLAWTASLPFQGAAWLLLALSRRLTHGRAP